MKKLLCFMLACILSIALLSACGARDSSGSSSAAASESQSTSLPDSSLPQSEAVESSSVSEVIVDRNPYPGQTAMAGSELSLQMYSRDGSEPATITLTIQQQNLIQQEVQSVIERYKAGDYPLTSQTGEEGGVFITGWPGGVGFPDTLPLKQMIFTTVGHEIYPMSVQVALPKGWYMECALVVDSDETDIDLAAEDNTWVVADAYFIDPNGLVHDLPGDPVDDDLVVALD